MAYPKMPDFHRWTDSIARYAELQHEHGAGGVAPVLAEAEAGLKASLGEAQAPPAGPGARAARAERPAAHPPPPPVRAAQARARVRPGKPIARSSRARCWRAWPAARSARPSKAGPSRRWRTWRRRTASRSRRWITGRASRSPSRSDTRSSPREAYTRRKMNGVPVDDDIAYTLLGLLIVEEFGPDFTIADVGRAWLKYLPYACTAEEVALENLRERNRRRAGGGEGQPVLRMDRRRHPRRSVGLPGAGLAGEGRRDGLARRLPQPPPKRHLRRDVLRRRDLGGLHGGPPVEALEIGLTEIPRRCALAREVRWALKKAPRIRDYRQARDGGGPAVQGNASRAHHQQRRADDLGPFHRRHRRDAGDRPDRRDGAGQRLHRRDRRQHRRRGRRPQRRAGAIGIEISTTPSFRTSTASRSSGSATWRPGSRGRPSASRQPDRKARD